MKKLQLCCWALVCGAFILMSWVAQGLRAQEVTAAVTGTVTDPSGKIRRWGCGHREIGGTRPHVYDGDQRFRESVSLGKNAIPMLSERGSLIRLGT
jgi:hypothetical protein